MRCPCRAVAVHPPARPALRPPASRTLRCPSPHSLGRACSCEARIRQRLCFRPTGARRRRLRRIHHANPFTNRQTHPGVNGRHCQGLEDPDTNAPQAGFCAWRPLRHQTVVYRPQRTQRVQSRPVNPGILSKIPDIRNPGTGVICKLNGSAL